MGAIFGVWTVVRGFIGMVPPVVWKWVGIAAIALGLFIAGDLRGSRIATEKCEAAARAAQVAANQQDTQAHKESSEQDLQVTNSLIEQKKVDDATIEKLKSDLAARPAGSKCEYDKSNADPDDSVSKRRSLRDNLRRTK